MKHLILFLFLSQFIYSCNLLKKKSSNNNSNEIENIGYNVPSSEDIVKLTPLEANSSIGSNESSFTHPSYSETETDNTAIDEQCIEEIKSIKASATSSLLTLAGTINVTSCVKLDGLTESLNSGLLEINMTVSCDGVDLSKYDGNTFDELSGKDICPDSISYKRYIGVRSYIKFLGSISQIPFQIEMVGANLVQSNDGGPCEANYESSSSTILDNCQDISKTYYKTYSINGESQEKSKKYSYFRTNSKSLKFRNESAVKWYDSGSMDIVSGDWTGTMTFTGGSVNPSYSITNGIETVDGTLSKSKENNSKLFQLRNASLKSELIGRKIKLFIVSQM